MASKSISREFLDRVLDPELRNFFNKSSSKVKDFLYLVFQKGFQAGYNKGIEDGKYRGIFEIKKLEKEAIESSSFKTGLIFYGRASHKGYIVNYITSALLSVFGIGLVLILFLYHDIKNTVYTITNDHIRIRKGILTKANRYIDLWRVQEIHLQEDIFNKLTNTIDLEVFYLNGHLNVFKLKGLPAGKNIHERLRDAVEVAKQKKILYLTEMELN